MVGYSGGRAGRATPSAFCLSAAAVDARIIGTGIGSVLFIYAVEDIGAAKTAFLTTSAPVFALPMGVLMLNEKLTPRELIGTVATIAGIWLVLL